jgi:hypothetical protein
MKLPVMQFSPFSFHLLPLDPNIFLSITFCRFLTARTYVLHPYKATDKTVVFVYFNLYVFK